MYEKSSKPKKRFQNFRYIIVYKIKKKQMIKSIVCFTKTI